MYHFIRFCVLREYLSQTKANYEQFWIFGPVWVNLSPKNGKNGPKFDQIRPKSLKSTLEDEYQSNTSLIIYHCIRNPDLRNNTMIKAPYLCFFGPFWAILAIKWPKFGPYPSLIAKTRFGRRILI